MSSTDLFSLNSEHMRAIKSDPRIWVGGYSVNNLRYADEKWKEPTEMIRNCTKRKNSLSI